MTPVTRLELYLSILAGGAGTAPSPITREEMYLAKACGLSVTVPDPITCREEYLYKISGGTITLQSPITRLEQFMAAAAGMAVTPPTPITREEWFWYQLSNGTTTITGVPPITFTSDGTALSAYSITGNMTQTGTPTPAQPIVPEECGDRTGNLCAKYTVGYAINASGTIYAIAGFMYITCYCAANQQYTFSLDSGLSNTTVRIHAFSGDTWITQIIAKDANEAPFTVTTPAGTDNLRISIAESARSKHPMLNSGSTALPYEPYGYKLDISCAGTTSTIYLQEPLRKIGDYADVVDSIGTVTRHVKKIVLDGTENWGKSTSVTGWFYCTNLIIALTDSALCSHYVDYPYEYASSVTIPDGGFATDQLINGTYRAITIRDMRYNDANDFKTWLAQQYSNGTPVCVWYVLATPTTESVTAPTITPASGSNTLSVGTTLAPSGVSITGHIS